MKGISRETTEISDSLRMRLFFLFLVILLLVVPNGCSTRRMMISEVAGSMETGLSAFEQDDDLDMLEAAFPANIKLLESLLVSDPHNTQLLVLLSRLYGSYTFAFPETRLESAILQGNAEGDERLKAAVDRYYKKGAGYALEALEIRHPGCREQLRRSTTVSECLSQLNEDDLASLFWYGFNLGGTIQNNRDSIRVVSKAHIAEAIMKRVLELDPSYYYGGGHLFLMIYYASRSPMMGGNPDTAQTHYQQLLELEGDEFLLADLFYARYYLQQQQERNAFETRLERVIKNADAEVPFRMLNQVAARRAIIYLEAQDLLFD